MRMIYSLLLAGLCLPALAQRTPVGVPSPGPVPLPAPARTGATACLPGLPEFVCGGMIQFAEWSPDGRYVLAVRSHVVLAGMEPSDITTEVTVYNAATRKSTLVLTERNPAAAVGSLSWLPGTSVAFLGVRTPSPEGGPDTAVWRVDARRAAATVVQGVEDGESVMVSPAKAVAFLWRSAGSGLRVRPLSPAGIPGAPIAIEGGGGPEAWEAGGARIYAHALPAPGGNAPSLVAIDPLTGSVETVAQMDLYQPPPPPKAPFRLESAGKPEHRSNDPFGRTSATPLTLVQGGKAFPTLMLAADADAFRISPRLDAVLYTNLEGAFVVPLNAVPEDAIVMARQKAQQAHLMSNGKQIGLALFMYAQDHDDVFPGTQEDLQPILMPYLKDEAVFEGVDGNKNAFHYLYGGGPMSGIADPANTVIGTIDGPGGQAQLFADGHVQWKNQ